MENFSDLNEWTPKKVRSLRNNLNNRLSSYKVTGNKTKDLSKSHKLYGVSEEECKDLLTRCLAIINKKN